MIIKQCQFHGKDDNGVYVHLLRAGYDNDHLVKEAQVSPPLIDEVQRFMKGLSKKNGMLYTLVSALGAGEYWGSNSNGDFFNESSLLHTPQGWHDLGHQMQKSVGAKWEWGYPTFYNAHAFQHHVNKDPERSFGTVEFACWDPVMKRVLLVVALDRKRAYAMGSQGIVDRIENQEYPDVSMGCRVPYDICSICGDWSRITGNSRRDLAEHRRSPIRGLSVTTKDYCFPPGTPITVMEGAEVPIENIVEGDMVVTHEGRYRPVLKTMTREVGEDIVRLSVTGLPAAIESTGNHPYLVVRELAWAKAFMSRPQQKNLGVDKSVEPSGVAPSPQWLPASELRPGDRLLRPVPMVEEDIGLPDDLVSLLGWYLADGHAPFSGRRRARSRKWYNVKITVNSNCDDASMICATAERLGLRSKASPVKGKNAVDVVIYGEWFAEQCVKFCGRLSKSKMLSQEVMHLPARQQLLLLQTYAAADGSVDDSSVRLVTTSDELASQLPIVLARCGMTSHVQLDERETNFGHQRNWFVAVPAHCAEPLGATPKKWSNSKTKIIPGAIAYRVKAVDHRHYSGPVYNFEVEEDHSYVAGGVAVHNCQHLQFEVGKIYPDGRRVWMWNLHPRFFDISFVYIGADKASKVMAKLASACPVRPSNKRCAKGCYECDIPSAHVHEVWSKEKVAMKLTPFEEFVVQHNRDDRDAGEIQDISKKEMERLREEWEKQKTAESASRCGSVAVSQPKKKKRQQYTRWQGRSFPVKEKTAGSPLRYWKIGTKSVGKSVSKAAPGVTASAGHSKTVERRKKDAQLRQAFTKTSVFDDTDPRTEAEVNQYFKEKRAQRRVFWDGVDAKGNRVGGVVEEGTPEWERYQKSQPKDGRVIRIGGGKSSIEKISALPLHKQAEIIKRIRSHFSSSLPRIDDQEDDIPRDVLDMMSGRLSDACSTAGSMGIVLKPREFQRAYLGALGRHGMADDLDDLGITFHRRMEPSDDFKLSERIVPSILKALMPMIKNRSAFGPPIHRRMMKITIAKSGEPTRTIMMDSGFRTSGGSPMEDHPLLQKVGAAYSNYRRQLIYKVASMVPRLCHDHPEVLGEVYRGSMSGQGLVKEGGDVVQSLLGMFPTTYLNRAYLPEPVSDFVEGHCNLGGLLASGELAERGGVA